MGDVIITGAGPNIPATEVGLAERQNPEGKGRDGVGVSIAISLSQRADSMAVWRFQVYAQTNEGKRLVGEFTTRPPGAGDPPSRVVAFASCPGAFDWRVVPFGPAPTVVGGVSVQETCEITIATTELSIAGAGVVDIVPVNGTRRIGVVHPAPVFLVNQGVLSTGPGQLLTLKGFVDPAQAGPSFIGVVDKATAIANGDVFLDVPIELPFGSSNFIDSWPDGLPFANQIRWCISTTQNPITLGAPVASVGARRI